MRLGTDLNLIEGNLNERQPQRKKTSMEDAFHVLLEITLLRYCQKGWTN